MCVCVCVHGMRDVRFCSRGVRANYTKYISIQNMHYIRGVCGRAQPTKDLVHFSLKIRHLMATVLIIFSHGQGKWRHWRLIWHFSGGANNMDGPPEVLEGCQAPSGPHFLSPCVCVSGVRLVRCRRSQCAGRPWRG